MDSHVYTNYFVPPNYDSMMGKIIVHGDTREQAMARMRTALAETVVEGINTNIRCTASCWWTPKFMAGGTNIHHLGAVAGPAPALGSDTDVRTQFAVPAGSCGRCPTTHWMRWMH